MNILVTGATGFVGRNLIPKLLEDGSLQLVLLVRDIEKAQNLYGNQVECISTDNLSKIQDYNPEVVIHLAAYLTSKDDDESVDKLLNANIIFGTHLLSALKACCNLKLFVNFGTCTEYRFGPQQVNNAYLYSATKSAFKQLLTFYAELSGYKHISLNPYTIYGGRDSQKKVIDFIKDSFEKEEPVKMSAGAQILDFIHVNDVVSLLVFIVHHKEQFIAEATSEYHLGSGRGISLRELASLLEKKYNKKCNIAWGALPYRERDVMYAVAPLGNLLKMGWCPSIKLKDAL